MDLFIYVFNGCQTTKNLWAGLFSAGYSTNILEYFLMWVFLQLLAFLAKWNFKNLSTKKSIKPASQENSVIFVIFFGKPWKCPPQGYFHHTLNNALQYAL